MKKLLCGSRMYAIVVSIFLVLLPAMPAGAQEMPLKIGVVTFLSGAAAGPFGVPAKQAGEVVAEAPAEPEVYAARALSHVQKNVVRTMIRMRRGYDIAQIEFVAMQACFSRRGPWLADSASFLRFWRHCLPHRPRKRRPTERRTESG